MPYILSRHITIGQSRLWLALTLCIALSLLNPNRANAAPGDLDPTFGENGQAILLPPPNVYYSPVDMIRQPADGKLVVLIHAEGSGDYDKNFVLARFHENGTLDQGFGNDGIVSVDFGDANETPQALLIQPDNKLVATGTQGRFDANILIARYLPDGTVDEDFGEQGRTITTSSDYRLQAFAVAIQADHKLVVAGMTTYDLRAFLVLRYDTDGELDSSFDGDGIVTTDLSPVEAADEYIKALMIQPDHKIVAVGSVGNAEGNDNVALARYHLNGTLDDSFGEQGKVISVISSNADRAEAAFRQADGKLVVAGFSHESYSMPDDGAGKAMVLRYHTNGSLDHSFGVQGIASANFGAGDIFFAVGQLPDSSVVAAGYSDVGDPSPFTLARFQANGTLDNTLGNVGRISVAEHSTASSLVVLPSGKVVTASWGVGGSTNSLRVLRFERLDPPPTFSQSMYLPALSQQ